MTLTDGQKPGYCPNLDQDVVCNEEDIVDECSNDAHCGGNTPDKCCNSNCGSKCVTPLIGEQGILLLS